MSPAASISGTGGTPVRQGGYARAARSTTLVGRGQSRLNFTTSDFRLPTSVAEVRGLKSEVLFSFAPPRENHSAQYSHPAHRLVVLPAAARRLCLPLFKRGHLVVEYCQCENVANSIVANFQFFIPKFIPQLEIGIGTGNTSTLATLVGRRQGPYRLPTSCGGVGDLV